MPVSDTDKDSVNPLYDDVLLDISARQKWAKIDKEILKRRLSERPSKSRKPYPGAPNPVVPIVDDVTTEKTEQEVSMLLNAPLMSHFIPLQAVPINARQQAAKGFDTFLRHICKCRPKIEEGDDTKNCRGFATFKVTRREDQRYGLLPDFEALDIRDVIVPPSTKNIQEAERIVHVLRYTPRKLRKKKKKGWKNIEEVIEAAKSSDNDERSGSEENSAYEETKHLIGLTTSGEKTPTVVIWEEYTYATEWVIKNAPKNSGIELDRKCIVRYSPDKPDLIITAEPWKEDDIYESLDDMEAIVESSLAVIEEREPVLERLVEKGKDRRWPFIQSRAENRSQYYYDTRGTGHKCMDDQIYASEIFKSKLIWFDYVSNPMFESDEPENSSNFSAQPGSVLKQGMKMIQPPNVPAALDFSIDYHKREASRRAGSASQSLYSDNVSESRKLQKTKYEVQSNEARVAGLSSASVDRFNDPWCELFSQLWEDLKRIKPDLPIIQNNDYQGQMDASVFEYDFLIVPASSAKTLNPDAQFMKAQNALSYAAGFIEMGATVDIQKGLDHVMANYDPQFANDVLFDPEKQGPQGQPPVYMELQNIKKAVQQLADMIDSKAKELQDVQTLSLENDNELKKLTEERQNEKLTKMLQKATEARQPVAG